jgi:hypothetical protein
MTRRTPILLTILLTATACGRKGARAADFDSATSAALAPPPGSPINPDAPHVARATAFDVGHSLDHDNNVIGGVGGQFGAHDSLMVSVHVEYTPAGTMIGARLRTGNRTVDSMAVPAPAPDSAHTSTVGMRFGSAAAWPRGPYQLEVFVGATSQGSKDFTIAQP